MPTKLEQVIALLGSMSKLELESTNAAAQAHIERLPVTTKCHLLNLPAELRNDIYYYAGIIHLREYGNTKRCGLLGVSKEVRIEFMDIFYSGQVVTLRSGLVDPKDMTDDIADMGLSTPDVANRKSLKTLLDGFNGIANIEGIQFASRGDAETKAEMKLFELSCMKGAQQRPHVLGLLELNSGDRARCVFFDCWVFYAYEYGLTYRMAQNRRVGGAYRV
ncbi:hypothetical protein PRZ48_002753 [Zasmidium cellare]|uniref:Uncharacterized protein n=1 Tax=Zasmidium cellare TaxID=395010 RepID=A0ABR0EUB9_ZASCE|nr:hypothetical protein PRZ48_002753 [Zasmidium cellare]